MIQVKCIDKFKDKQGRVYGYKIQDINGQTRDVKAEELKSAVRTGNVYVVNLKLTSDNRLIDKKIDNQLKDTTIFKSDIVVQPVKINTNMLLIENICKMLNIDFKLEEIKIEDKNYTFKKKFKTELSDDTEIWIIVNKNMLSIYLYTNYICLEIDDIVINSDDMRKEINKIKTEIAALNINKNVYINNIENIIKIANHHNNLSNEPYIYLSAMIKNYANRMGVYSELIQYMHNKREGLEKNTELCNKINKILPKINKELAWSNLGTLDLDDMLEYAVISGTTDIDEIAKDATGIYLVITENELSF